MADITNISPPIMMRTSIVGHLLPIMIACAILTVVGCSNSRPAGEGADTLSSGGVAASEGDTVAVDTVGSPQADPSARRLDSLVALSSGDYVHLEIGPCFGFCDAQISLYASADGTGYTYNVQKGGNRRGKGGPLGEAKSVREDITKEEAAAIFKRVADAGIDRLLPDTTFMVTDLSYIWVRARIGAKSVAVDNAYLGGERYIGGPNGGGGLKQVFDKVEEILMERYNKR